MEVRCGGAVGVGFRVDGCNGDSATSLSHDSLSVLLAQMIQSSSSLVAGMLQCVAVC